MTNSLNGTSLLNRLRQAVHNKMHGANIFWWCWKKVWQVYTNALHGEKLCNHCIQVWRWEKIWWFWKKSVTSVYNALYREKLWNHCIQVWRWKNWPLLGTNIFWWCIENAGFGYLLGWLHCLHLTTVLRRDKMQPSGILLSFYAVSTLFTVEIADTSCILLAFINSNRSTQC